jgi:2,4-dienoyl-CoA reductase (NADPH2)
MDDDGLHLMIEDKPVSLDVVTVIICAGQEPLRELYDSLDSAGVSVELIGGAFEAAELNATAAINHAGWSAAKL